MKKSKTNLGKNGPNSVKFVSKPLCDCTSKCGCQPCDNVGIRKTNSPKVSKAKKKSAKDIKTPAPINVSSSKTVSEVTKSLLDVLKDNQDCTCETVARAVRSDVYKNLDVHHNDPEHSKYIENKTKSP